MIVKVRQNHFFFFKMGLFIYSAACKTLRSASKEFSECACFYYVCCMQGSNVIKSVCTILMSASKGLPKGGVITSPFRYSLMIDYSDSGEYQPAYGPNGLPEQGSSAPDSTVAYLQ